MRHNELQTLCSTKTDAVTQDCNCWLCVFLTNPGKWSYNFCSTFVISIYWFYRNVITEKKPLQCKHYIKIMKLQIVGKKTLCRVLTSPLYDLSANFYNFFWFCVYHKNHCWLRFCLPGRKDKAGSISSAACNKKILSVAQNVHAQVLYL